jgi:peptide deformylase
MTYKIIKDKKYLSIPTKRVETVDEGYDIAEKLKTVANQVYRFGVNQTGLGLSANQIGINKRVSIIFCENEDPITLINPEIVEATTEKLIFYEGCLSLPTKNCFTITIRHRGVKVSADNFVNTLEFCPVAIISEDEYRQGRQLSIKDDGLLKCIAVQHEIGHLDGKLITDSGIRFIPVPPKQIKIGRNDKVVITHKKTGETKYIKYKHALELLEPTTATTSPEWQLV